MNSKAQTSPQPNVQHRNNTQSNNSLQPQDKSDLRTRIHNILSGTLGQRQNTLDLQQQFPSLTNVDFPKSAKQSEKSPTLAFRFHHDAEDNSEDNNPIVKRTAKFQNIQQNSTENMKNNFKPLHQNLIVQPGDNNNNGVQQISNKKTRGALGGNISPDKPPMAINNQQINDNVNNLQRLLSEESSKERNENQINRLKESIKIGFQENLNKRASNGQGSKNGACLNKAVVTSYNDSSSTKYNSYLLKSMWLLTSIKSKKMQEIVQSRQKNCQFCKIHTNLQSSGTQQNVNYSEHLKSLVRSSLDKKYLTSQDYYNSKIVSDIMYNENRHIVSVFKDYLIFDDFSEYLKRYYKEDEAIERLPRVFEFYEKYSKVFPNYVVLPENKYTFKNIERKQKLIDEKHQQFLERQDRQKKIQEEAKALGLAMDSSLVQRMRISKNMLFGSQFLNNLTDLEESNSLMRQQSSKVLDMLSIQHNIPLGNSMMNQFIKQTQNQSRNKDSNNFENLIQRLIQYDKIEDGVKTTNGWNTEIDRNMPDLHLSMSSQAMESFLHDFDLSRASNLHNLNTKNGDESHFCVETPANRSLTSFTDHSNNMNMKQKKGQRTSQKFNKPLQKQPIIIDIEKNQAKMSIQQNIYQNINPSSINSSKNQITSSQTSQQLSHILSDFKKQQQLQQFSQPKKSIQQKEAAKKVTQNQVTTTSKNAVLSQSTKSKNAQVQIIIGSCSPNGQASIPNLKERQSQEHVQFLQQNSNASLRSGQSQNIIIAGRTSQISLASPSGSAVSQGFSQLSTMNLASQNKIQQSLSQKSQATLQQIPSNLKQIQMVKNNRNTHMEQVSKTLGSNIMNTQQSIKKTTVTSAKQQQLQQQQTSLNNHPTSNRSSQYSASNNTQKMVDSQSFVHQKAGKSPMRKSPDLASSSKTNFTEQKMMSIILKNDEISRSFKGGLDTKNNSCSASHQPMISSSIKEAVNKLLPPQPQTIKQQKMKANRLEISTPTPQMMQSSEANNPQLTTTALLTKLLNNQQQITREKVKQVYTPQVAGSHGLGLTYGTSATDEKNTNQVVYSTRSPQKKNFSSPGQLQSKITQSKAYDLNSNNHIMRKSAQDAFPHPNQYSYISGNQQMSYEMNSISNITSHPIDNSQKMIVRKVKRENFGDSAIQSQHQQQHFATKEGHRDRERGGSEKISADKLNSNQDLFIIPEKNIYTIKGAQQPIQVNTSLSSKNDRRQGATDSSLNIMGKQSSMSLKQKRAPSNTSDKSANSQKSNYSNTSNPYQRTATAGNNTTTKKKIIKDKPSSSLGDTNNSSNSGLGANSNKLYEKIKNANTNKKNLATIFTFNK